MIREDIIELIKKAAGEETFGDVSVPEVETLGHYSTNVAMRLAKVRGTTPMSLAAEIAEKLRVLAPTGMFEKIEVAAPGFINFWLSKDTIQKEFSKISKDVDFGRSDIGKKKTIIVESSSVNIAKPFHLGHFRTTIIGAALANIFDFLDYKVIRWNYLGDWGTQFGKLIVAYRKWGNKEAVEKDPIGELQKLYVRFHEEALADLDLEELARQEFQKLESGDAENRKLWEWFKRESLVEFEKIYKILGVEFDVWVGESFYEKELKPIIADLVEKKIAVRSEGALVVMLDNEGLPPALIEKTDGASLYATRDLANLQYRLEKYHPDKILYVVANEQALYFSQLFAIAKRLHMDEAELVHVKYGMMLGESGKKFSTRRGDAVAIRDILDKAIGLARDVVDEKARDLSLDEKNAVAQAVGAGALKYSDLKENRNSDIVFDWDTMLAFNGDSAPYLQYTHARSISILRKSNVVSKSNFQALDANDELALMRKLFQFPDVVVRVADSLSTSFLATYLHQLAVTINKFYESTPILKDENEPRRNARLLLIGTSARILKTGLGLLGIQAPEKI